MGAGLEARSALRVVVVVFGTSGVRAGDALPRRREEEEELRGLLCGCSEDGVLSAKCCIWPTYPIRLYLYVFEDLYVFLSAV